MKLSAISIKRPVFAWTLMFGLIFFGILAFMRMGVNEKPDVDFPTVTVRYWYNGATPAVIEKDVIEPVESFLVSMEGIRNLSSTATRSQASISIEFELTRDIDFALQETQTLLGRAQRDLPPEVEPPVVTKSNAADERIVTLGFSSRVLNRRALMVYFRDRVRDRLTTIEGVAEIRVYGYHEPMMRIDLNSPKLSYFQLTVDDIVNTIEREHEELPAGKFEKGELEDLIRIMGEGVEPKDFKDMVISQRGGAPNYVNLRISNVADVYEGLENVRRISRFDGENALAMAVFKQRGVNAVAVAEAIKKRVQEIQSTLPEGTEFKLIFDGSQFIKESVDELIFTLILSAILTSLVCWLFLGSWSATWNILLAIPTAIVGTFLIIEPLGFTLNTFTLLGLTLAVGIVVDDAIIMLENIARYMKMGYTRLDAAFKGSREITFAVIATTLALVSIFIPLIFLEGIEGRFFIEFAATIAIAISLSSLEALTLAPMRCSQFLRLNEEMSRFRKKFDEVLESLTLFYKEKLEFVLHHRWKTLIGSFLFILLSILLFRFVPYEFAPPQDRGVLFLIFLAPDGKSLEYTNKKIMEFEEIVKQHPDVAHQFVAVGGFGQGGQGNRGNGAIVLKDRDKRNKSNRDIAQELREKSKAIKGIKVIIRDNFGTTLGNRRGSPIEFTISGPDLERQREYYKEMEKKMKASKLFVSIRSDDIRFLPEVQFIPNRRQAFLSGVVIEDINSILNTAFGGTRVGQYTTEGRRFDIFVQLREGDRDNVQDAQRLWVRNNRGELLRITRVTKAVRVNSPESIFREDRIQGVRVDASLPPGVVQSDALKKLREIVDEVLPDDYFIRFSSAPEDTLFNFILVMVLGLLVAYMVLGIQFNSFSDPFVVFLAIPFGLVGSLCSLLLGGETFNIYSAIGIFLTMGIVKKNSILLVEFTNQIRDKGKDITDAILTASPTRLRPILMTTFATLAAALPPALSLGAGSETRVPMALTILGGVSLSAVFTLFVVPVMYSILSPKRREIPEEGPDIHTK